MESQGDNLQVLNSFLALQDDWDFNGAPPLSKDLVGKVQVILYQLHAQPEIMPTPRDSIQLEYEKENLDYLEIELFASGKATAMYIPASGETKFSNIAFTAESINKVVDTFYGGSI